ncbi:MAG: transglutaminase-like cysteine peptidase [Geminicoccaceae bacterium]
MNTATLGLAAAALAVLAGITGPAEAADTRLFGTVEFRAASHAALPQWQRVLDALKSEQPKLNACASSLTACENRTMKAWGAMVRAYDDARPADQLQAVNRFFNSWGYRTDRDVYGRSDYWATPFEFMSNAGDCEDYAIAKFATLRSMGYGPETLRLVVLQDTLRDEAHAVLAVYNNDDVWILDNLTDAVLSHERLSSYVPYYSVNEEARWAHVAPTMVLSSSRHGPSAGLKMTRIDMPADGAPWPLR